MPYFIQIPLVFDTPGQQVAGYASSNNPALAGIAGIMGRIRWSINPNGRDATDMFYSGTTVPTGLSGVAPPGPAMPVTETATSARLC